MQRIIFFLVFFMPLQALAGAGFDSNPALEKAEKSIWRICNSVLATCGSGFFIDENTFITNLHVIDGNFLEDGFNIGRNIRLSEFYLRQKDAEEELSLKSVHSLSIPYDLIVLETNEPVEDYLSLKGNFDYGSGSFSISYAKSKFTKAYSVGDVVYEDDYMYDLIVLLEGTDDLSKDKNRFTGGSGSPILNRKAEVVGVLTKASYNFLRGMKAGLLNNMLKADKSSGIGFIGCKGYNVNFCFIKHKQAFVDYILAKTNGLTALPEEADPDLGFYLLSFAEKGYMVLKALDSVLSAELVSANRISFYRMFLEKKMNFYNAILRVSAGLNYQPAVMRLKYIYGHLDQNENILYNLIVSSDYFSLIPYYMENFYDNETEDRKKTLEISLMSCVERRFWPCETALSKVKPRLYSIFVE